MRLHRFFVPDLKKESRNSKEKIKSFSIFSKDLINQWKNVFRFHVGDKVILFGGSDEDFNSVFESLNKDVAVLVEEEVVMNKKTPKRQIALFASILKKDNFEFVLEKATELGVSFIVPVISEGTEKTGLRKDRLEKILKEATEQSGWPNIPKLYEPTFLKDAVSDFSDFEKIVFDEKGEKFSDEKTEEKKIGIFIGPEGGWGEGDRKIFKENNLEIFSLGEQTLRAQTASIVALSVLLVK